MTTRFPTWLLSALLAFSPVALDAKPKTTTTHVSKAKAKTTKAKSTKAKSTRTKATKTRTQKQKVRRANAYLKRSAAARSAFMRQTGYPHGRPGYIVDHIVPLACGGADAPSNMQWQTVAEAKAKDRVERKGC